MTITAKGHWRATAITLAVILGVLAAGMASGGLRQLIDEAADKLSVLAVAATLPAQIVAILLCSGALWVLRPGVGFWGCLNSRLLRDAGDNLLVFLPGLGEVIGARALVLSGGRTRAAVTASALDKFAETVAQIPYIILAAVILLRGWRDDWTTALAGSLPGSLAVAVIAGGVLALGLALSWLLRARDGYAGRFAAWIRRHAVLLLAEMKTQKAGLPASLGLHFVAWVMGGVQIWMAAHALGFEITLYEGIALESAAYAGRAILFFIPAGLVTQEAGLVAAGLIFGLAPAEALAIGLVLRLRDVVLGVPLLAWPIHEYRHARKARKRLREPG
ncbi:MAG: lysylphosphatidylglycerol synthase domain-containing protein [Novosphingobium sp.]